MLEQAKTSAYQSDFSVIYSEAIDAVTKRYPNLVENPAKGIIKTAWHPLSIRGSGHGADAGGISRSSGSVPGNNQGLGFGAAGSNQNSQVPSPSAAEIRDERINYFVRFEVAIVGRNPPFRVRVHGEASAWQTGKVPAPLRGANIPTWLGPRVDAMKIDIHEKLNKYAVHLPNSDAPEKEEPLFDKTSFAHLGSDAGVVLGQSKSFAKLRDASQLKDVMAEDFVWKVKTPGSADIAAALFEADPERFNQLELALDSSCEKKSDNNIECRTDERVAEFTKTEDGWKFSSFY